MPQIKLPYRYSFLLFFAVMIFWPFCGFSQGRFIQGYIITLEGDTLHGEFRDQTSAESVRNIFFRGSDFKGIRRYTPADISGYGLVNGSVFLSQSVMSSDSSEMQHWFMRLIFDGRVRILVLADSKEDRYFIEKSNELFELTNSHTVSRYEFDNRRFLRRREYVGMLKWLFAEGVELDFTFAEQIENTGLNPVSLVQTAQTYHHLVCDEGEECLVLLHRNPFRLRVSPFVGYGFSLFTTNNYLDAKGDKMAAIPSFNPRLGARLDFHLPSFSDLGRFFIAISYERFNGELFREYKSLDVSEEHVFAAFSAIHTNIGVVVPLKKLFYPSQIYFGYRQSYIFNGRVYSFPRHVDKISARINLDDYLQGTQFGKISLGAVAGYQYLYTFSPKMALSIGLEFSLIGTGFNDETRFLTTSGLQLGFVFN